MAKNYIQDGNVLTLTAPTGGVTSGALVAIGTLVVVAIANAAEGALFAGKTNGVWEVDVATGLTAGDAVGLLGGEAVAAATDGAIACGKLVTDEAGGKAHLLLTNAVAAPAVAAGGG